MKTTRLLRSYLSACKEYGETLREWYVHQHNEQKLKIVNALEKKCEKLYSEVRSRHHIKEDCYECSNNAWNRFLREAWSTTNLIPAI